MFGAPCSIWKVSGGDIGIWDLSLTGKMWVSRKALGNPCTGISIMLFMRADRLRGPPVFFTMVALAAKCDLEGEPSPVPSLRPTKYIIIRR